MFFLSRSGQAGNNIFEDRCLYIGSKHIGLAGLVVNYSGHLLYIERPLSCNQNPTYVYGLGAQITHSLASSAHIKFISLIFAILSLKLV